MQCPECEDEVDELVKIKVGKKILKLCTDCADRAREEEEVSSEAESAMKSMMEYKGR